MANLTANFPIIGIFCSLFIDDERHYRNVKKASFEKTRKKNLLLYEYRESLNLVITIYQLSLLIIYHNINYSNK
jgi:hypothetical protein